MNRRRPTVRKKIPAVPMPYPAIGGEAASLLSPSETPARPADDAKDIRCPASFRLLRSSFSGCRLGGLRPAPRILPPVKIGSAR